MCVEKWNGPFCSFSFRYFQIAVLQGRVRQLLITVSGTCQRNVWCNPETHLSESGKGLSKDK